MVDAVPEPEEEPVVEAVDLDGDLDEDEPQSGLGRGLAAIIPTLAGLDPPPPVARARKRRGGGVAALLGPAAEDDVAGDEAVAPARPEPAPSAVRKLRDDLVGALLDGLANTMALDLCAYLHEGPGEDPHLFLQAPSLDAIGPARSYELLDALRIDLEKGRSEPDLATAGFRG